MRRRRVHGGVELLTVAHVGGEDPIGSMQIDAGHACTPGAEGVGGGTADAAGDAGDHDALPGETGHRVTYCGRPTSTRSRGGSAGPAGRPGGAVTRRLTAA